MSDGSMTANTRDCIRGFIGQKVVGVLFDTLPLNRKDLARGTKTLIFEDGRGLTFSDNGSYWPESAEEVKRAVEQTRRHLETTQRELEGVLTLAGAGERGRTHGG